MRRVALVTPAFPPALGGVEAHVAELAKRLAAHGWQPEVLTQDARTSDETTGEGVRVHRFALRLPRSRYPTAPGLWRHLARSGRGYDLVHAHSFHSLAPLPAALFARAFVFTPHYHGLGTTRVGRLVHIPYRPAGRLIFSRAGRVICVSGAEAARVAADFPAAAARAVVIPNGIDLAALRAAAPFPHDHPVVLTAGRLHRFKRVDRLLGAMAGLDGARLVVVGDGAEAPALRAQAERLGLGGRVTFTGRVEREELDRWLRTATVYVSLSEQEAFGIGVAEGAGAGARVLASDIAAHREIATFAPVELVPPGEDAGGLGERLRRALAAGRPAAAADVTGWDEVAARTAAVYDEVA